MLGSSQWDAMNGRLVGPPEWPFEGGYLRQPARLVSLAETVRAEMHFLGNPEKKAPTAPAPEQLPPGHVPVPPRR